VRRRTAAGDGRQAAGLSPIHLQARHHRPSGLV
jgi:hypothetical protein